MRTLIEYIRITLFVGGAFIGVQVPSFVDQYGQRLESHMLESQTSLEGFQADANKYFNGNIETLIQHYAKNADPVINDGGTSIASLYSRAQFLNRSWAQFNSSFQQRYWHAFANPVKTIQTETWEGYDYAIKLDTHGIAWALGLGFLFSALIELCLITLGALLQLSSRSKSAKPRHANKQQAPNLHGD